MCIRDRVMGVREILQEWTAFRVECVRRRTYYDLHGLSLIHIFHLGTVALYQMSYGRILENRLGFLDWCLRSASNQ